MNKLCDKCGKLVDINNSALVGCQNKHFYICLDCNNKLDEFFRKHHNVSSFFSEANIN